jgi:hypothetical protein
MTPLIIICIIIIIIMLSNFDDCCNAIVPQDLLKSNFSSYWVQAKSGFFCSFNFVISS